MTINIKNESGMEKEHHVPQDKELQVHAATISKPVTRHPRPDHSARHPSY